MSARKKVVVAMSGGVDSSVAAALLQRQGYECIGVFMRLGGGGEAGEKGEKEDCALPVVGVAGGKQGCCSAGDAADARYVAGLLGMAFYALNFQQDFAGIIDYFVREYNAGRTPNPCVRCNEYLKFGKLARYADAMGAHYIATGHYARVAQVRGETHLLRGRDLKKDQSYVLFGIPRGELPRMLLPIGDLAKAEVRRLAEEWKLPVFNKPDSQEICFVPDNDYARLVQERTPERVRPGEFVDAAGKVLGTHAGHQHFTIGQRKGTGVALGAPAYVSAIDPSTNRVTLAGREALWHRSLRAREVNWIAGESGPVEPLQVVAKVRYNSPPTAAVALMTGADELTVRFEEPVLAITPGQAVVCYEEATGRLLGGAWIEGVGG